MSFKIGDRVVLKKETYHRIWAAYHQIFLDTEYVVTRIYDNHDVGIRTVKGEDLAMAPNYLQFSGPWGNLLCNCRNNHTFTPECLDCVPKHYP